MSSQATSTDNQTDTKADNQPKQLPPYNVVLIDDNDHTYQYVIDMVQRVFAYSREEGYRLAKEVDTAGRAILITTTKEHAELKRDQVIGFGPDPLLARCKGSMTAVIEPAEGNGDGES